MQVSCFNVAREEENKMQEAHLRREMEEREKVHRETVERLHIQVRRRRRGDSSLGFAFWKWWPLSHAALSQIAQLERKEPERRSNTADTPVTGRQTNLPVPVEILDMIQCIFKLTCLCDVFLRPLLWYCWVP